MEVENDSSTVVAIEDEAISACMESSGLKTPTKLNESLRKAEVKIAPSTPSPTKSKLSKEDSLIGYVHMLSSPISNKRMTMKYSNLVLQTNDKEIDVLVYSPRKRPILSESENSRTPVKIRKHTYTSDHTKLIINDMAEISHPSLAEYCFQYVELSCQKCISVKKILESSEEGGVVSVMGEIANVTDTSTVGSRSLKMAEATLLDTTGEIKISMFEETIASIKQGAIYNILNSRVRSWNGVKKLSTTPSSIISQTEDEKLTKMAIEDIFD